jgi:hypothetical protein
MNLLADEFIGIGITIIPHACRIKLVLELERFIV